MPSCGDVLCLRVVVSCDVMLCRQVLWEPNVVDVLCDMSCCSCWCQQYCNGWMVRFVTDVNVDEGDFLPSISSSESSPRSEVKGLCPKSVNSSSKGIQRKPKNVKRGAPTSAPTSSSSSSSTSSSSSSSDSSSSSSSEDEATHSNQFVTPPHKPSKLVSSRKYKKRVKRDRNSSNLHLSGQAL